MHVFQFQLILHVCILTHDIHNNHLPFKTIYKLTRIHLILLFSEYFVQPTLFHKRRIIEGLMIQQGGPSLNKQVHSYIAKLFPLGIP